MNKKQLYLIYGGLITASGCIEFVLTEAKSVLISTMTMSFIIELMGVLIEKYSLIQIVARIFNLIFLGVFTWRANMAITALINGHSDKLIISIVLGLMTLISFTVFFIDIFTKNLSSETKL
jgi:hypothetical protein